MMRKKGKKMENFLTANVVNFNTLLYRNETLDRSPMPDWLLSSVMNRPAAAILPSIFLAVKKIIRRTIAYLKHCNSPDGLDKIE
jgi:hypothetical protein